MVRSSMAVPIGEQLVFVHPFTMMRLKKKHTDHNPRHYTIQDNYEDFDVRT